MSVNPVLNHEKVKKNENLNTNIKNKKSTMHDKKCDKCLSSLRENHKCTPSVLVANVKEKINTYCSLKEKGQIVSSLLKDIINTDKKVKDQNLVALSQCHGKSLIVDVKPKATKNLNISVDSLYELQNDINCSDNTMFKIPTSVRRALTH